MTHNPRTSDDQVRKRTGNGENRTKQHPQEWKTTGKQSETGTGKRQKRHPQEKKGAQTTQEPSENRRKRNQQGAGKRAKKARGNI